MAKFTYTHKVPTVATIKANGNDVDINLNDGDVAELPETHDFVKLMIAQGKLAEVKETKAKQV